MARINTGTGNQERLPESSDRGALFGVGVVPGGDDTQGEPSVEEAEWPADLDPELREFLESELTLFVGLQGVSHIAEHRIRFKNDKPLKQRYYPKNSAMQSVIDKLVDKLIQAGAIEPSRSPHCTPIVLVKKKTDAWCMCIDYRQLNARVDGPRKEARAITIKCTAER
ncbi:uncharacterized protein [Drosophila virilis]|uniref:uncharacterized protein n=1 Tax=Drosophila virilis TaxID=7244 RepID=UPI0038B36B52